MADELINLVEYAKGIANDDPTTSALVEQFAMSSDVLQAIPFKTARDGSNPFMREADIPSLAFRAINDEPEISHGDHEELRDQCYPISGLLEFDRVLLRRYGEGKRMTYMMGQMKAGAELWTTTFIDGDNATDPKEWSGLKARLVADSAGNVDGSTDDSRLIANGTGSGGAALSLAKMDLALDNVNQCTHIIMNRTMRVKFEAAARDPALTNNRVTNDMDSELGRRVLRYAGVPILTGYNPSKHARLLPFNEVAHGGGSAVTTSIYFVSFREDGVCGIQTAPPEAVPIGNTDRGVHLRDLFEWDNGITIEDQYSALRLSSITNAAIVA